VPETPLLLASLAAAGAGAALVLAWWERRARRAAQASARRRAGRLERLERALDFVQEGVIVLDPHNRVLRANPAAASLLGGQPRAGDAAASPLAAFARWPALVDLAEEGDPEETLHRVLEEASGGGDPGGGPDGSTRLLEVTRAPLGDGCRVLVLRDLEAVERVDRKRRDFVANASHELQTPIAALVGILDLLDEVEGEERARLLERARRNAQSLASLTRNLLGLARAEDPDWRPSPRVLRLQEAVAEALEGHRAAAAARGLALAVQVEPPDLEVLADPLAFRTVLGNLVENAVTYTEEGRVAVRVAGLGGGGVVLEVRDTGPGVDPAILPRIFERFFRGDPARSRAAGGTGLGLAIVRNLLRHMGGRIAVESRPGAGSVFRVELPANPARPLPGAGQADFRQAPRDLHKGS